MQINFPNNVGLALCATGAFTSPIAAISAGSGLTETPIAVRGPAEGALLGSVSLLPSAALTASDTDYITILVQKRTAGAGAVTLATTTTKTSGSGGTGNWTAWKPVTIPLSAPAILAANDAVTITITASGAGVAVPVSVLTGFEAAQ